MSRPDGLVSVRDEDDATIVTCAHCDLGSRAFCAGLTTQQFRRFMSALCQATAGPGVTLFQEGEPAGYFYTLTGGSVKLYKLLPDGRRQIIAFVMPGEFFGLANTGTYVYSAESLSPVMVCRFPRRKLEALFAELPRLERKLLEALTVELATAQEQILLLGRKTARERIASFLIALGARLSSPARPAPVVPLPMGRLDIADYLGLTVETVSRTLTGFKQEGLIALPAVNQVALLQRARLARIAQGD
jgi:CRP/FNR family transcriptional regulator